MPVREVTQQDKEGWDAFVLASPASSFLQTWAWGQVQEKMNAQSIRLVEEQAGEIVSVALVITRPLPFGFSWMYVPRGPVGKSGSDNNISSEMQAYLVKRASEQNAIFVRIDPAVSRMSLPDGWRKADSEMQPKQTRVIHLEQSEEEILAQMHSKARYNVRLAERKGVQVRFSRDANDVEKFLTLTRDVTDRSGFSYHPDAYYHAIIEAYPDAEVAIAEHEGDVLAVHVMIYAGQMATYAHGVSSNHKRNLMAPQYLYWQTMRRAKERGCTRYDMYGVAPEGADSSHPWAGISRIKEKFGGEYVAYAGAYDYVVSPLLYAGFKIGKGLRRVLKK